MYLPAIRLFAVLFAASSRERERTVWHWVVPLFASLWHGAADAVRHKSRQRRRATWGRCAPTRRNAGPTIRGRPSPIGLKTRGGGGPCRWYLRHHPESAWFVSPPPARDSRPEV